MRNRVAVVLVVLCLIPVACRRDVVKAVDTSESDLQARDGDIEDLHGNFDTFKRTKDPKGGLFGPHLRNGYPRGEDVPVAFCDAGPSIPTGVDVTVFYHTKSRTSESSECKLVAGVVKGEGFWKNGRAVTGEELEEIKEQEEHFVQDSVWIPFQNPMELAWRNLSPVGEPCQIHDPDGLKLLRAHQCSIAIVSGSDVDFLNWKVTGILDYRRDREGNTDYRESPTAAGVVNLIRQKYGDKYVISR